MAVEPNHHLLVPFLEAEPPEKRRMLEDPGTPLLRPQAEAALRTMAAQATSQGNKDAEMFFLAHAELLLQCRDRGVAAVFGAIDQIGGRDARPDPGKPTELTRRFLAAQPDEMRQMLEEPGTPLLRPEVEAALRAAAAAAAKAGNGEAERFFDMHADLLRQCRERGTASVFAPSTSGFNVADAPAEIVPLLRELSALGDDRYAAYEEANLGRRVVLCRTVLARVDRATHGMVWAGTQTILGNTLQSLGALHGDAAEIEAAATAYREAMKEHTRERAPMQWAGNQNNLGATLLSLGDLRGDAATLEAAAAACREALKERTRERDPMGWAATQTILGATLRSLGDLRGEAATLEAAAAACREALKEHTRERVPMQWATTQITLGTTFQLLGKLHGDAATLEAAAAAFREALKERTRERAPMGWAETQDDLGNTLRSLAKLRGDAATLEESAAAFREALKERTRERAPMRWAATQSNLGATLLSLGDLRGDAATLEAAAAACREALKEYTRERSSRNWAATQNNLGGTLLSLGDLRGDAAMLEAAATAYGEALTKFTRERAPMDWAGTQTNLGVTLRSLGDLRGDAATLEESAAAFREALKEYTRQRAPMNWARTQDKLGITLYSLGKLSGDAATLEAAAAAYREALKERTRERAPMDWAATQNNLGVTLHSLAELRGDAATLEAVVAAFREALKERTRERDPMGWAMTQTNLGNTFESLGSRHGDAATLEAAAAAYREALKEFTRKRAPMNWAMNQNNLGGTLRSLGELRGDAATLEESAALFCEALKEYTRERSPMDWARTQDNLGGTLAHLGDLRGDATMLEPSAAAYREALKEYTRERAPMNWARTQNNLGSALQLFGAKLGDAAMLEAAAAAFRETLPEFTRERAPIDWARTQHNLGVTLAYLGNLLGDPDRLEQAMDAWQACLSVRNVSDAASDRQNTAVPLIRLLLRLGREAEAEALIVSTLARSDAAIADAARSREGKLHAVAQVEELHGQLSRLRLRAGGPDAPPTPAAITAALEAAEAGRARLLAEVLGTGEVDDGGQGRRPPLTAAQILAAAPPGGAIVVPVLTAAGTHVLFARHGANEPDMLELDGLTRDAVLAHLNGETGWLGGYYSHAQALSGRGGANGVKAEKAVDAVTVRRDTGVGASGTPTAYEQWNERVRETQAWLWRELMGPIHARLSAHLDPGAPVVILPPGLLSLLPMTAAGPGPDGQHFLDHWTVSLTPSVRTFMRCEERKARTKPTRLLGVFDPPPGPMPKGQKPPARLAGARMEARMLQVRCGQAGLTTTPLTDAEARLDAVRRLLPWAGYFHASTHGMYDSLAPERSALQLAHGDFLRPVDLPGEELQALRLVYLSACESALSGVRRAADEFIGLGAAFVASGAAGVVGTLWPVFDDVSFLLADRFYELHFGQGADGGGPLEPAAALREAQRWLRDATFGELRQRFLVGDHDGREYLLIGAGVARGPMAEDVPGSSADRPRPMFAMPLGPDDEKPFNRPHEWAACTLTGV